jgi:hypothetical protein
MSRRAPTRSTPACCGAAVLPVLGDLRVDEIGRDKDIDPWKVNLSADLMPAGVQKHWAVLSMVMRDAVPRFRPDNPLDRQPGHWSNGLPKVYKYNACFYRLRKRVCSSRLARMRFAISYGWRWGPDAGG